ncbi:hypothetical protein HK098_007491, partial [Nowakowskiella sp. JEL0407]
KSVSLSTAEAEFVGASNAARSIIWARNFLSTIGCEQMVPMMLYVYNQAASEFDLE